jgi:hypothetical protein
MTKLSETQLSILRRGANGVCIKYEWRWLLDGRPVTRQVNGLIKRGLMDATYFRDGAAVNPTEAGRRVLAEVGEE